MKPPRLILRILSSLVAIAAVVFTATGPIPELLKANEEEPDLKLLPDQKIPVRFEHDGYPVTDIKIMDSDGDTRAPNENGTVIFYQSEIDRQFSVLSPDQKRDYSFKLQKPDGGMSTIELPCRFAKSR